MTKSVFKNRFRAMTGSFIYLLLVIQSASGQIHPIEKESEVRIIIHNFGFRVTGSLAPPVGNIRFSPDSLAGSYFHVTIKSESINTDNNSRDEHLRNEDYFDVKKYPVISFVSDNIRSAGKNDSFIAAGKLTIKNKTRDIQLPFTAQKTGAGYLFQGSFKMDRRDYGVGESSTISNELTVDIKVVAR